jgi:triosephosphate isomerase
MADVSTTYIVGNWKMYCSPAEASMLVNRLSKAVTRVADDVKVVLCPPSLDITTVRQELSERSRFVLGAQNAYPKDEGAFTGEVSFAMLKDLVDFVIVGHSERRHTFHERDGLIAQKVAAAFRHEITPILCVGETAADRTGGHEKVVVADQLETGLALMTGEDVKRMVIAYEPVWAIGTGDSATPDDAKDMMTHVRRWLTTTYGVEVAQAVPILYGGSVKPENAGAYLNLDICRGLLVGVASTNYQSFAAIIAAAESKRK